MVGKGLTHGSLFAGIEGFGLGFRQAGFKTLWQVEKEPFCQAVLKTHFPEAELFSDVRDCGKSNLRAVDVVTSGFPCQDLSVAGKRAGLGGSRSGLFWEAHRIIGELQPTWFVIENVPGLFSSNAGRDFGIVINAMDELGYGLAWRVLDSQYFGVAQRRRRVFIVGRFGEPCPQEVLFESAGGEGDFAESGEATEGVAREVAGCLGSIGDGGFSANCEKAADGYLQLARMRGFGDYDEDGTASALKQRDWKDATDLVTGYQLRSDPGGIGQGWNTNYAISPPLTRSAAKNFAGSGNGNDGVGTVIFGSDLEHQERSSQQFNSAGEMDGAMRGDDDDGTPPDSNRVRDFAGLPEGLDSARYRALGNAVTANVARWIAERILEAEGLKTWSTTL